MGTMGSFKAQVTRVLLGNLFRPHPQSYTVSSFISASSLHKCSRKIVFSPSRNVGFLQLKLPLTHPFLLGTRRLPAEWLTNYLPNWTNLRELKKEAVGVQGEGLTHARQLELFPSAGKKVTFQNLAV